MVCRIGRMASVGRRACLYRFARPLPLGAGDYVRPAGFGLVCGEGVGVFSRFFYLLARRRVISSSSVVGLLASPFFLCRHRPVPPSSSPLGLLASPFPVSSLSHRPSRIVLSRPPPRSFDEPGGAFFVCSPHSLWLSSRRPRVCLSSWIVLTRPHLMRSSSCPRRRLCSCLVAVLISFVSPRSSTSVGGERGGSFFACLPRSFSAAVSLRACVRCRRAMCRCRRGLCSVCGVVVCIYKSGACSCIMIVVERKRTRKDFDDDERDGFGWRVGCCGLVCFAPHGHRSRHGCYSRPDLRLVSRRNGMECLSSRQVLREPIAKTNGGDGGAKTPSPPHEKKNDTPLRPAPPCRERRGALISACFARLASYPLRLRHDARLVCLPCPLTIEWENAPPPRVEERGAGTSRRTRDEPSDGTTRRRNDEQDEERDGDGTTGRDDERRARRNGAQCG